MKKHTPTTLAALIMAVGVAATSFAGVAVAQPAQPAAERGISTGTYSQAAGDFFRSHDPHVSTGAGTVPQGQILMFDLRNVQSIDGMGNIEATENASYRLLQAPQYAYLQNGHTVVVDTTLMSPEEAAAVPTTTTIRYQRNGDKTVRQISVNISPGTGGATKGASVIRNIFVGPRGQQAMIAGRLPTISADFSDGGTYARTKNTPSWLIVHKTGGISLDVKSMYTGPGQYKAEISRIDGRGNTSVYDIFITVATISQDDLDQMAPGGGFREDIEGKLVDDIIREQWGGWGSSDGGGGTLGEDFYGDYKDIPKVDIYSYLPDKSVLNTQEMEKKLVLKSGQGARNAWRIRTKIDRRAQLGDKTDRIIQSIEAMKKTYGEIEKLGAVVKGQTPAPSGSGLPGAGNNSGNDKKLTGITIPGTEHLAPAANKVPGTDKLPEGAGIPGIGSPAVNAVNAGTAGTADNKTETGGVVASDKATISENERPTSDYARTGSRTSTSRVSDSTPATTSASTADNDTTNTPAINESNLAHTGASVIGVGIAGIALLVAGAVMFVARRKKAAAEQE